VKTYRCYDCAKKLQGGYNKKDIQMVQNFIDKYDIDNDCELLSTDYID